MSSVTYDTKANDPVVVYKNGGFGFNCKNQESSLGFVQNMLEFGAQIENLIEQNNKKTSRKGKEKITSK